MTFSFDIDTLVFSLVNFAVIGLFGWLLKKWITTKLETRSAQRIEELKAALQQDNEIAVTELKDKLEQDTRLQLSAHASFAAAHEAAAERRLAGAEALWTELLRFRGSLPPVLTYMALRNQAGTSGSDWSDGLSLAWLAAGGEQYAEPVVVKVAEAAC